MSKTVILYDQMDGEILFRVAEGDHSHLHGHYINSRYTPEELWDEINALTLFPEGHEKEWRLLDDFSTDFPINAVSRDHAKVVVVGMIP